jgi:glycerol-3-phosphate acyltransferase PlsY
MGGTDVSFLSASAPYFAAAFVFGYLLGAIPFGLLLTRIAGLGDIRSIGSGNIGATNVLRTGNKALAAATLLLDGGKGAVAVLLAGMYGPDTAALAALGAVLGHMFPVWLRFKGGKAVATALGIWLALAWPISVAACAIWLLVAALFRYSSLAGLVALAATPLLAWFWLTDPNLTGLAVVVALLVFARHHANIRRLLAGNEPKIGRGKARDENQATAATPNAPAC